MPDSASPGRFGLRFLARSSVTGGAEGATLGLAAGGVVAAGGVTRGGMTRFGPFCGTGGREASLVSAGGRDGVGTTFRGGAVGRFTGGKVGDGLDTCSVALSGGVVAAGVLSGGGVLR